MRSSIALAALLVAALTFGTGCALPIPVASQMPVVPSVGLLFEQYKAPVQTDAGGKRLGRKMGTAKVRHIFDPIFTRLPLVTWGDSKDGLAVMRAAENGGITTIRHIDYERTSVLSILVVVRIIVYGD